MKIKLSKSQWQNIGKKAGWIKASSEKTTENHKVFDNKKDALAFLSDHALMSVGWQEGNSMMEACYWNGKVHITKSDVNPLREKSQKWWSSLSINQMKELTRKYYPDPHITWSFISDTPGLIDDIYQKENNIKAVKTAGGYGRFSKDLSDIIEGQALYHKESSPQEIAAMIKADNNLVRMMREEEMSDEELMEIIIDSRKLYELS